MNRLMMLPILAVAALSAACEGWRDPYVDKMGHFVFHNTTLADAFFHVNNGQGYPVPAKNNREYTIEVPVPKTPRNAGEFGTPTGPTLVNKTVQVFISVRSPARNVQTRGYSCPAGGKVITNVNYYADAYGNDWIECTGTSPYGY